MGNANTIKTKEYLPINFKEIKRQQHSILGNIRHIENKQDEKNYILIQKTFGCQTEYQKCLKKIKSRIKLSKMQRKYLPNDFIMEILQYRSNQYTQICGKTFKIFIFIEKYDTNLKNIYHQKLNTNQSFTEQQLLQLILSITNCLIQLYDHNIKPFHLSMESIVYKNQKLKLIDYQLSTQMSPIDSYNYKSQLKTGTYIAPQILAYISHDNDYIFNSSKCDIFTLAMLVLQLTSKSNLDYIYDYNSKRIHFSKIQCLLNSINFSQFFLQTIKQMLSADQNQRTGLLRLKQKIKNYTKDLLQNSKHKILQRNLNLFTNNALNNQKLVVLGKRPESKLKQNRANSQKNQQIFEPNLAMNNFKSHNYHVLHNNKFQNRSKKSISFGSQLSFNNTNLIKQQKQTSLPKNSTNNMEQRSKSSLAYQPNKIKSFEESGFNEISDNRSDKPISPVTHQYYNNLQSKKDSLVIHEINKKKYSRPSYGQLFKEFDFANLQLKNPMEKKQSQGFIKNKKYIQISKQKLKFKNNLASNQFSYNQSYLQNFTKQKLNYNYLPQNSSYSKFNPINKQQKSYFKLENNNFSTPRIQKIQTNNLEKHLVFSPQKMLILKPTPQKNKHSLVNQTPIKSLQLLQTIQKNSSSIDYESIKKKKNRIFGRYDFSNGALYQGQFNQNNQFQGNGVLYFPSGKVFYSGCWKTNLFDGFGVLNNIDQDKHSLSTNIQVNYKDFNMNQNNLWSQYQGQFCQDKKHGFGTLYFTNGSKFSGCFVNDSIQGYGNFYQKQNQKTIMGIWNNNIFQQT